MTFHSDLVLAGIWWSQDNLPPPKITSKITCHRPSPSASMPLGSWGCLPMIPWMYWNMRFIEVGAWLQHVLTLEAVQAFDSLSCRPFISRHSINRKQAMSAFFPSPVESDWVQVWQNLETVMARYTESSQDVDRWWVWGQNACPEPAHTSCVHIPPNEAKTHHGGRDEFAEIPLIPSAQTLRNVTTAEVTHDKKIPVQVIVYSANICATMISSVKSCDVKNSWNNFTKLFHVCRKKHVDIQKIKELRWKWYKHSTSTERVAFRRDRQPLIMGQFPAT